MLAFQGRIKYLNNVSKDGGSVDPEKIHDVKEWPIQKDLHELRSFLGLCTYYRSFVSEFVNIDTPLFHMTEES